MLKMLWRQLQHRRGRSLTLSAGILVASVSFSLLTAAASTGTAEVRRTVHHNFRAAYDILVRPAGSTTSLERSAGLVQQNYLAGIFGGISQHQWHAVENTAGVAVAAPIAMVGYILPFVKVPVDLGPLLTRAQRQIFRVQSNWTAENGLTHITDAPSYVYVTRNKLVNSSSHGPEEAASDLRGAQPTCDNYNSTLPPSSGPFDPHARTYLWCYFVDAAGNRLNRSQYDRPLRADEIGATADWAFPFLLAAVDPVQEARLAGVNQAITTGRYLSPSDRPHIANTGGDLDFREIPVVAAARPYVDDELTISVERLPGLTSHQIAEILLGGNPYRALSKARGVTVLRRSTSPNVAYQEVLSKAAHAQAPQVIDAYWSANPNRYRTLGPLKVRPLPTSNPPDVWTSRYSLYVAAPPDNHDTAYRRLTEHVGSNLITGNVLESLGLDVVGRFDPERLPEFNPLTRVPLTTYNPPTARPGDARSTRLLHGRDLSPDANIAGYLQSPPLLLTTMRSLPALTNPEWYSDTNGARPISVIRVRVGDLRGSVRQQLARIGQVALAIKKATGLQVDVTAGASPTSVSVDLPAGRFGRPALTLSEPWVKKGVAVAVLTAVDRKSAALFVLILIVTAAFLANGAFAAVRARRHEIGVLRCLGWPRGDIFRLVLGELVVLGLLAGVAGAAVSALAIWLSGLDLPLIRVLLVPPVAVALALLAGFTPAWRAGRGEPLDAVAPAVLSARRTRAVHRVSGLGLSNLRRMPGRAALAAVALAVGVAALTVLLAIQFSFGHEVAGTALGGFVTNQVRGVDYFSAALAIGLGGASVADVLYLNLRERAPEFAALAAMGWRRKHLVRLGWVEGSAIGLIGSMIGAGTGFAITGSLATPISEVAAAAVIAAVGGWLVVLVTARAVLMVLDRLSITTALADS